MEKTERIARLISARILGQELTEEEKRELDDWLGEEQANKDLLEEVRSLRGVRQFVQLEQEGYGERMAAAFAERCRGGKKRSLRRIVLAAMGSVAAVVVLVVGLWMWTGEKGRSLPEVVAVVEDSLSIQRAGTVLTLASGERIDLKQEETEKAATRRGGEQTIPAERMAKEHPEAYHTLSVPAGGEFQYVLADGTKVWLNSDSELRFPTSFTGDERRVYLKGEAFFDVKKDNGKPVCSGFAERGYQGVRYAFLHHRLWKQADVRCIDRGSIGFTTTGGEEVRLKPADRLTYEAATGILRVEQVDTTLYMSWINKMFVFKGQPLGEIMETLSRWYNLDCMFASEDLKQVHLSGRLNRYQDIRVLLKTYEEIAGLRFRIEGRQVFISRK